MEVLNRNERCWVIVPVKILTEAKSRLAPVLSAEQRRTLATELLERTLKLLHLLLQHEQIAGFVTISNDPTVLTLAQEYSGYTLAEEDEATATDARLNLALARAARWCQEKFEASTIIILPSDLPLLETEDLESLLEYLQRDPVQPLAVLAPDRHNKGTNALLLRPANLLDFTYYFGEQSFERHLGALRARTDVQTFVCRRPGLAFDLDWPEDLAALAQITSEIV